MSETPHTPPLNPNTGRAPGPRSLLSRNSENPATSSYWNGTVNREHGVRSVNLHSQSHHSKVESREHLWVINLVFQSSLKVFFWDVSCDRNNHKGWPSHNIWPQCLGGSVRVIRSSGIIAQRNTISRLGQTPQTLSAAFSVTTPLSQMHFPNF